MDHSQCPFSHFCVNRRSFLAGGGMGLAGFLLGSSPELLSGFALEEPVAPVPDLSVPRTRVGLIFSHISARTATWPQIDYDYEGRKKELEARLRQACPRTEFIAATAMNAQEARELVAKMQDLDGFVAYPVGIWTGAVNVVARSGKPVVIVDDLYAGTGEFIGVFAEARRQKLPVVGVASSDFQDVVKAVRLFEVLKGIQSARIVDVTENDVAPEAERIKAQTGIRVMRVDASNLEKYYQQADERLAARWAEKWMGGAAKVVEPTREEVVKSGKMHLAIAALMKEHAAEAVTIDCLTLFYGGKLSAYPCLSFCQLNDDGLVGACEGDLNSTVTMVLMRHLAGLAGFISDPVFDTSKSEIIYAHCVAPTKVFGPDGRSNAYALRSHAEDKKGAALQSFLPLGETVTTLETNLREKGVVIHTARTTRNIEEAKACRTKLAAQANVEKLMSNWKWGWHRVTYFGQWKPQVRNLATLMGLEVFEEDT